MSSTRKRQVLEQSDQEKDEETSPLQAKRVKRASGAAEQPSGSDTTDVSMGDDDVDRSNSTDQTSFHLNEGDEEEDGEVEVVDEESSAEEVSDNESDAELEEEYAADAEDRSKKNGSIADMGIIERVEVYNFMCHEAFSIDLGPQVNFVIGHNGSGKSAILTAITVALGGKVGSTGRGSGLKSLVRAGTQTAEIVVHIKNEGEEAFKPEKYGKKIIIVRRINADGGGSWKIKSAQDKIISTKREELDAIADRTNIQADNPMSILSQDAARSFLATSAARDKYDFFLRGTQLQQLTDEYDTVRLAVRKVRSLLSQKKEGLPILRNQAVKALDAWKAADQVRNQARDIDKLKQESVWAQVRTAEETATRAEQKVVKAQNKAGREAEQLAGAQNAVAQAEQAMEEIESRHRERADNVDPLKEQMAELNSKIKANKDKLRALMEEGRSINEQVDLLDAGKKEIEQNIRAEQSKIQRNAEMAEKRRRDEDRRDELKGECESLMHQSRDLQDEDAQERSHFQGLNQTLQSATAQRAAARDKVANLERMQTQVRASRSDRLAAFGPGVPTLSQAIQKARWQGSPPLGPLGRYCKLKEGQQAWADIIESVLGKTLNAFLVDSRADQRALNDLMKRFNVDAPVILQQAENFDYSHGEPAPNIRTILRVLDISNDTVLRALINTSKIECTALVTTRTSGDTLMATTPQNVKQCYSGQDKYKITGGRNESKSSTTVYGWSGPPRLTSSTAQAEQQIAEQIQQAQQELIALDRAVAAASKDLDEWRRRGVSLKNKISSVNAQLSHKERELSDLDVDMEEEVPEGVTALEENLRELDVETQQLVEKFKVVDSARRELSAKNPPLVKQCEEIHKQINDLQFEDSAKTEELQAAHLRRTEAIGHVQHYEKKVQETRATMETLQKEAQELRDTASTWEGHALEYTNGERLDPSATWEQLTKQMDLIERKVNAFKRSNNNIEIEQLDKEAQEHKATWVAASREIKSFTRFIGELSTAVKVRLDKWRVFRRLIAIRARGSFTYYLSKRGYTGSLKFDHNARLLGITVRTDESGDNEDEGNEEDREKAANTLSGGEKSFSTICLLLSLWSAINSPIRCLDEFDVFMDAVNRKIAMKMIIEAAKSAAGVQFMLITPLNMPSGMQVGKEVRITKLNDPDRVAV